MVTWNPQNVASAKTIIANVYCVFKDFSGQKGWINGEGDEKGIY